MPPDHALTGRRSRADVLDELRRLLPRMERVAAAGVLPFGIPALDSHLPHGGLAFGALHEVIPRDNNDLPAAFGFLVALLGHLSRKGPLVLVLPASGLARCGRPLGHGLNGFGLDPGRMILVETANEQQTLWAMEEALRSTVPAGVAGAIERLDLKTSQRLHFAAGEAGLPLLLLRITPQTNSTVAATRWRLRAAQAPPDEFSLIARWRWRLQLERCRNGRPGEWLVEFDHVAHCFSLAAALADPALPRSAGAGALPYAG